MKKNNQNKKKCFVSITGGLGDQINQYLFSRYIKKKFNLKIVLDKSYFEKNPAHPFRLNKLNIKNLNFEKNIFKIQFNRVSYLRFVNKFKFLINILSKKKVNHFIFEYWKKNNFEILNKNILNNSYFFGYWHNSLFYKKDFINITKELSIKKKTKKIFNIIKKIKKKDIAIHVRGGDFLSGIFHPIILDKKYYTKGIKYFSRKFVNPKFYVFTDDIIHTKKVLPNTNNINYVFIKNCNFKDFEEFEILKNFENYIISNSTFSWTASLLSKKKKIILAPSKWYKNVDEIFHRKIKEMKFLSIN